MSIRAVAVGASLLTILACGPAAAQSYGPNDQILTIDATAFLGFGADGSVVNEGYLYKQHVGSMIVYAPLSLPDGARITQICLYARNEDPSNVVDLGLQQVKLPADGETPSVGDVPGSLIVADFHFGFGTVCTDASFQYEFHQVVDVDGDGTADLTAHRLWAFIPQGTFALGGARITWHRQVSPPPATPTFADVPASHPFFQYIEALYASGITGGCATSPARFCPDAPLTRAQMAAFLAKALGLHWPN
jgi:hypothetical protein